MANITMATGKVKYGCGKPKDFGHGDRINAVVTLDNGEEVKLWGKPDDQDLLSLRKGQAVNLIYDGKNYKLVNSQPVASSQTVPTSQIAPAPIASSNLSTEQKKAIAEYIEGRADLLKYCWTTAKLKLGDVTTDEESLRSAASTLFIAAQKKFNL
ncbi:hypothetical protein [Pseudanabaena minima]|uniref:hypothetical protein n=1 Tax=Pseudanabaena minima TaxID=890415 RepID=UPI003DA958A3